MCWVFRGRGELSTAAAATAATVRATAAATAAITAAAAAAATAAAAVTIAVAAAVIVTAAATAIVTAAAAVPPPPAPSSPPLPPQQSLQSQLSQRAARELGTYIPGPEGDDMQKGRTRGETARQRGEKAIRRMSVCGEAGPGGRRGMGCCR